MLPRLNLFRLRTPRRSRSRTSSDDRPHLVANGSRVRLFRDVDNVIMDLNGIERIDRFTRDATTERGTLCEGEL